MVALLVPSLKELISVVLVLAQSTAMFLHGENGLLALGHVALEFTNGAGM
jgi:hypothetical protein